jgi:hypothetical protein
MMRAHAKKLLCRVFRHKFIDIPVTIDPYDLCVRCWKVTPRQGKAT